MKSLITIALFIIVPLLAIFSVNTLFGLGIEYSFLNWFAAYLLVSIFAPTRQEDINRFNRMMSKKKPVPPPTEKKDLPKLEVPGGTHYSYHRNMEDAQYRVEAVSIVHDPRFRYAGMTLKDILAVKHLFLCLGGRLVPEGKTVLQDETVEAQVARLKVMKTPPSPQVILSNLRFDGDTVEQALAAFYEENIDPQITDRERMVFALRAACNQLANDAARGLPIMGER